MNIVYRLSLYDNSGALLTSLDTSIHSDSFIVTSQQDAGGRAYIESLSPGFGRAQIPGSQWEIGRYGVSIVDMKTGTDNAERWVTAFLGDDAGRNRMVGAKALVEERIDAGPWVPIFAGRVLSLDLTTPQLFYIELTDDAERLKRNLFESYPENDGSNTRVIRQMLAPLGWETDFGGLPSPPPVRVRASVGSNPLVNFGQVSLSIDPDEADRPDLRITENLRRFMGLRYRRITINGNEIGVPIADNSARVVLTTLAGQEVGVYSIQSINASITDETEKIRTIALGPGPGAFMVMGVTPGAEYLMKILPSSQMRTADNVPFILFGEHPIDVIKDVLAGEYDGLADGVGSYVPIEYDEANLDAIKATTQAPPFWALVEEPVEALEFIEKSLLAPYGLAWAFEPASAGVATRVRLFSLDLPSAPPAHTILDTDVIANEFIEWNPRKPISVKVSGRYLMTRAIDADDESIEKPYFVTEWDYTRIDSESFFTDMSEEFQIEGLGLMSIEADDEDFDEHSTPLLNKVGNLSSIYLNRFGQQRTHINIAVKREEYENVRVGDWVIAEVQWQPSSHTMRRGSPRLMQVVEKRPAGPRMYFELVDSGIYAGLPAPQITSAIINGTRLECNVQAATDGVIRMQYAVVDSQQQPGAFSHRWEFGGEAELASGQAHNFEVEGITRGRYIYVRARTERSVSNPASVPSIWVTALAGQSTAIPAPSALAASDISYYSASLSWNNAAAYETEVWASNTEDGTKKRYSVEAPGTDRLVLTSLDRSPVSGIVVSIRHRDVYGNLSSFNTITFSRGSGTNQAPSLRGLFVFIPDYFGDTNE